MGKTAGRQGQVSHSNSHLAYPAPLTRPLRIEFAGAIYHLTSRDDWCEAIYEDDENRNRFLGTLAEVGGRFNGVCHGYCLMSNHCRLVVETPMRISPRTCLSSTGCSRR